MNRPAVLYARLSPRPKKKPKNGKVRHHDAVEDSCDAQLSRCGRFAGTYDYAIIGQFAERRRSGSEYKKRPEFRKAMKLAASRKAILIVYSQSRFARNTEHACRLLRYLLKNGAALASVKECIDTSNAWGRAMFRMKAVWDEFEREQTSERTSDMMRSYQSAGRRMSSKAPFGWSIDPDDGDRLIENPDEQDTLAMMLRLRTENPTMGLRAVGRALEAAGRLCRGKPWRHEVIKRLLARQTAPAG